MDFTSVTVSALLKQKVILKFENMAGTSLAVQWLRLRVPKAGGTGSTPGRGTKIPHAAWPKKQKRKEPRNMLTL